MLLHKKTFIIYTLTFLLIFNLMIFFFYYFFPTLNQKIIFTPKEHGTKCVMSIIYNNSKNYCCYFITFFLSWFYIAWDIMLNAYMISLSLQEKGFGYTSRHLLTHGIIELPNFIIYSYMSFYAFLKLVKNPKKFLDNYIKQIKINWKIYAISFCMVIIAGVIEGTLS